ncbi:MAG: alpha/beta hydrolase family protein, partial [Candidatus Acidiferrum sp.]
TYEGTISADRQSIDGVWSQGEASLPLELHRQAPGAASKKPADAVASTEGLWQGAIETSGMRFRVQLHVSHDDKNELVAALDSIDQGVNGLPATHVAQKDAAFHFEIPAVSGTYDGTLNAAKNAMNGAWSQSGTEQKLEFKRSEKVLELRRQQNPVKPYPYKEEEVTFPNAKAGISLAGTLTLPPGAGAFPAALLICGSGPHDRDEALAGHRPFLVLADFLTRKGIAVLRYDKRGNGKSTGSYAEATSEDFASDVSAAIAYLKTRKEIDAQKIGLIGHSEGGILAPMIASRSNEVPWIVLLAGPGLKGEDILLKQSELISRAANLDDAQIAKSQAFDRQAYALVRQEKNRATLESKLNELVQSTGMAGAVPPAALQAQFRMLGSPWFRFFLDYDPVPTLEKTRCPLLALNGEKDLQVASTQNLPAIQKALETAGNKDFQVT